MNDRISASIGLTCHLGRNGGLSGMGVGQREGGGKSVEAGTVGVAGEEMCLGDRRRWAMVGEGTGDVVSGCQVEGWGLDW